MNMKTRITKEEFVEIFPPIVQKYQEIEQWISEADKVFPTISETLYDYSYHSILFHLVRDLVGDTREYWLDYFLYEHDGEWFTIYKGDKEIYIDSYEKLYDLIAGKMGDVS